MPSASARSFRNTGFSPHEAAAAAPAPGSMAALSEVGIKHGYIIRPIVMDTSREDKLRAEIEDIPPVSHGKCLEKLEKTFEFIAIALDDELSRGLGGGIEMLVLRLDGANDDTPAIKRVVIHIFQGAGIKKPQRFIFDILLLKRDVREPGIQISPDR